MSPVTRSFNMFNFLTSRQFALPAFIICVGLVVGLVLERVVLTVAERVWSQKGWHGWPTVKKSLRGMITLWFAIVGVYAATRVANLDVAIRAVYHKAFLVLMIFTLTLVIARISAGLVDLYIRRAEGVLPSTTIWGNVVRLVAMLTGVLVILKALGAPIAPILTALGVGGFAMALAFQDTLSNLFSGLHVMASRQVGPGDYIKLDTGDEGYVVDVTWRNTTIQTLPNNVVVIPNNKLASAVLTNYHRPVKEISVLIDVGVSYESDLQKVEQVTLEVARQVLQDVQGGVTAFEPRLFYREFSDFRIVFTVVLRAEEFVDNFLLKHEFIKRLHERYRREGIEIPSPVTTVHLQSSIRP